MEETTNILTTIIEFISSVFVEPFKDIINNITEHINELTSSIPTDMKSFLGTAITTFIPVKSVAICISILIPILTANLIIALVLRVKSFIPTMGGK